MKEICFALEDHIMKQNGNYENSEIFKKKKKKSYILYDKQNYYQPIQPQKKTFPKKGNCSQLWDQSVTFSAL